jgi:hypothetical protein
MVENIVGLPDEDLEKNLEQAEEEKEVKEEPQIDDPEANRVLKVLMVNFGASIR